MIQPQASLGGIPSLVGKAVMEAVSYTALLSAQLIMLIRPITGLMAPHKIGVKRQKGRALA